MPTHSGHRPTKVVDRNTDVRLNALKKSRKCVARSKPERAASIASRLSSAATPRRARRVARLRDAAPATRQHAIATGAASPATPRASAADELMPITAAAAIGQTWLGVASVASPPRFATAALSPFAARFGTVRRRECDGKAANGRIAAVAAIQSSWLRINAPKQCTTPGEDQCDDYANRCG